MDELIALARDLAPEPRLTGELLAAALERAGWSVLRAGTGTAFPRVWQKGTLRAGIQGDGPGVRLSVTLWWREVEEDDEDFVALEALYEEAEAESRRVGERLDESLPGASPEPAGGDPTDGLDYLHHRAWRLTNRTLLVGAIQHDNGLPVFVEAVIG